ncbi:MAG: right-handed parallel beta-helix repeat-containing protein [Acidobacteria bacterium]|nr:right-handed parallel beta-helix repeat-containing protein [Acidobacteriota bacterium]
MRLILITCLLAAATQAQNPVTPGRFHIEHPTLLNLGFEWAIQGDANRNATVEVRFRKTGTSAWRNALPLLRIGGERSYRDREAMTYTAPHGFAGSILNLEPATSYECEFTMKDPDGVTGQAQQKVTVSTRAEPRPYSGGRTLHVYPADHIGPKQEPSFIGLKAAYYGEGRGDWTAVRMRKAQPGDTILIHAGLYRPERYNYVDPLSAPFHGYWSLSLKGTADKPITIKGAGDGEAIFDGGGNSKLFDMIASSHHIIEGLTFRNTEVAIFAGEKEVLGAVGLTVRNCRFEDIGVGVWTEFAGSSDFYIADNLFLGREDQMRLIGWNQAGQRSAGIYPSHQLRSFFAIKVYGPGHIIAHNAVAYFHDGICISTYGPPEEDPERQASSIDIYNNDIHLSNDDFIETDGGSHNVRVFNNRGINAAHNGYSAQPFFGGPVYFIRNILYHVPAGNPLKFSSAPAGIMVLHNTFIGEQGAREPYSNSHFRNNLFLGKDIPNRGIMAWAHATPQFSSDYNGFRPNRDVKNQYTWIVKGGKDSTYSTLAELAAATKHETHGIELDFDIFENLTPDDPSQRYRVYHSMDLNFRLKPNSKAVDAGVLLPTINDNHTGRAPDLGALETGQPEPHYGPRWITWKPFYR